MTLLPMENKESILCALKCFEKDKSTSIPPILDDYIKQVAKNGQTMLPWIYVKPLMLCKYNKIMDNFLADYSTEFLQISPNSSAITELRQRVYNILKHLDGIPFTVQRLCELLENPFRHYSRPDKFLRGLEKVLMVVSTVDPQGNKIHLEDPRFPSQAGMEECSMIINDTLMSPSSSPLMDNIREHHTSKSSDEEITEDENGDENEEDEEEADDEDREVTDDSNDVNRIERIPILNEENASDAPSLVKRARPCASWYPNAGTTSNSTPDATSGNDNQDEVQDSNQPEDDGDEKMSSESPRTFRLGLALMEDGDLSKTEKLVPDSFSEDSIRDKTDHCEPERRGEAARQHTLEAEGEVKSPSITVDGVPPIRQILRPIGQLEAFVQNMAADVPGGIVPDPTPPTTVYTNSSASDAIPQGCSPPASNHSPGGNPCSSPMSAPKRRASGSLFGAPGVSSSPSSDDSAVNLASPGALQSPAKRRRITNAQVSQNTIPGAENSGSLQNSLNDSPPIIVCSPLPSGNRDRDSGECLPHNVSESVDDTTPWVVGLSSVDSTRSTNISGPRDRTSAEPGSCLNSNGMTMVRIDMETGEEEEDREVEPDRTDENPDSQISGSLATALKQEMAGGNQQADEDSS